MIGKLIISSVLLQGIWAGSAIAQRSTCPMGAIVVRDNSQARETLNNANIGWEFCTLPSSGSQALIVERSPSDQRRQTVVENLRRAIPNGDVIEEVTPNTKRKTKEGVTLCDRYTMGVTESSPYRTNLENHYQGETWLCRLPSGATLVAARLVYDSHYEQILQLWVSILGIPPSEIVWHKGETVLSSRNKEEGVLQYCQWGAIGIKTPTVYADIFYRAYPNSQICRDRNDDIIIVARIATREEYDEVFSYLTQTLGIPASHIVWNIPSGKNLCDRGSGRQPGQCEVAK